MEQFDQDPNCLQFKNHWWWCMQETIKQTTYIRKQDFWTYIYIYIFFWSAWGLGEGRGCLKAEGRAAHQWVIVISSDSQDGVTKVVGLNNGHRVVRIYEEWWLEVTLYTNCTDSIAISCWSTQISGLNTNLECKKQYFIIN